MENLDKVIEQKKVKEEELSRSLNGFKLEIEEVEKQIIEKNKELSQVVSNVEKEAAKLTSILKDTKAEEERLLLTKAAYGKEIDKIKAVEGRAEEIEASLSLEKIAHKEAVAKNQAEIERLNKENAKKEETFNKTITSLKSEIETLKHDKNVLIETSELISKEISEKNIKVEDINEKIVKLNDEISVLEIDKESILKEIAINKAKAKDFSETSIELAEQIPVLQNEIEILEAEKVTAQKEVDALVLDKINFQNAKTALDQRQAYIEEMYKKAGIKFQPIN